MTTLSNNRTIFEGQNCPTRGILLRFYSSPLEALSAARSESPDLERAYERRKIAGLQNARP
jgi:hypothetical protein